MVSFTSLLLIYLLAMLACLYMGISLLKMDQERPTNRVFFAMTLFVAIWIAGYAGANLSQDMEMAILWRRFSSAGRLFFYSIMLHFVLLLTLPAEKMRFKASYLILHLPPLALVFPYSLLPALAGAQYQLLWTHYGWINKVANNVWDLLYYLYFISYVFLVLYVMARWRRRLREPDLKRQAGHIVRSILAIILLGMVWDVLLNIVLSRPLPQLTPVFILIPLVSFFHAARKYRALQDQVDRSLEILITQEQQKTMFRLLALAMVGMSLFAFSTIFFPMNSKLGRDPSIPVILSSATLLAALLLFLSQSIRDEGKRRFWTALISVSFIPIFMFAFLPFASVTVWVLPIAIMMSSLLFTNTILLTSAAVVGIASHVLVWFVSENTVVIIDAYDFIARIIATLVALFLGLYINRSYLRKTRDNERQVAYQRMLTGLSADFVSARTSNIDEKIKKALGQVGAFFGVDRTYLFTIDSLNETMTYAYEWCGGGIGAEANTIAAVPLSVFPWWLDQLRTQGMVYIEDIEDMPEAAGSEQDQLRRQGVQSLVSVPVLAGGEMVGFVGIDSVKLRKVWSREKIDSLHILANLMGSALGKVETEAEIDFMAHYDQLTQLPNRFHFMKKVEKSLQGLKEDQGLGVIFVDLDNFKLVNDTIGHKGGDDLLRQVADDLQELVRSTDMVARFGGDEFMILLTQLPDEAIKETAQRMMEAFEAPFLVNNQYFKVTASAGVALYPKDGQTAAQLVKHADMAMYKAKSKGKNQVACCDDGMREESDLVLELTRDLGQAIKKDELRVHYQPQIDLAAGKMTGVEALLRWQHPRRGMISPGTFIPLAEKNGLINDIGRWVLRQACRQNKAWQDQSMPPLMMAVNLSGTQLLDPKLADYVQDILKETDLDASYLELEITEGIAIKDSDFSLQALTRLKEVGVSLAIDDFGTEYSSLGRLKLLPIDRIKIDMQFVQGIESSPKDQAITTVIIHLGKSLGINVLAEGVETEPQLDFLGQKMCDNVQGFYCFEPMPQEEMALLLKKLEQADPEEKRRLLKLVK